MRRERHHELPRAGGSSDRHCEDSRRALIVSTVAVLAFAAMTASRSEQSLSQTPSAVSAVLVTV